MTDWEFIEVEREGRVGIVRFNRPERMNAFGADLAGEIREALEEFNADPGIGAIVTTGNGRAYSSGADLSARMAGDFDRPQQRPKPHPWDANFLAVECKPLIAAVNGIALGIGLTSILWYDAIIASTESRFSMRFVAIGLTPEFNSSWLLPRVVGLQKAKEMMLTGRIYSAQEALEFGLVHHVVEPDQLLPEAIALGQEIAANPVSTLRTVKTMTFKDLFAPDLAATEENSRVEFDAALQTPEHREAVRAFVDRRTPRFHDAEYMRDLAEEMRQG